MYEASRFYLTETLRSLADLTNVLGQITSSLWYARTSAPQLVELPSLSIDIDVFSQQIRDVLQQMEVADEMEDINEEFRSFYDGEGEPDSEIRANYSGSTYPSS